jgi:hypothetical protein
MRIINVVAFVIMIAMNYLANSLPLNNRTTGELSAQYPNLFVPAGFTFSIWGVIYFLLAGFCILQFVDRSGKLAASAGWLFAASCILNALWIVAWHYEFPGISLVIMVLLLATLVLINYRIAGTAGIITRAAFGIYLGWICIATIANATAFLVSVNWQGWGISQEVWAMIMIVAGAAITIFLLRFYRNPFTGLAVIWALTGIIIARWPAHRSIVLVALLSIAAITVITVLIAYIKQDA